MKNIISILSVTAIICVVALSGLGAHTGTPDPDVPIGSIIAWHKSLGGVPQSLPSGWVQCDGQLISDPRSPLNNQNAPNLSGGGSFLRGDSTSGSTGGANTHSHLYSGTTDPEDSDQTVQAGGSATLPGEGHAHPYSGITDAADSAPPYMTVVWIMRIK